MNTWNGSQRFELTNDGKTAGIQQVAELLMKTCESRMPNNLTASLHADSTGMYLEVLGLDSSTRPERDDDGYTLLRLTIDALYGAGWVILDKRQEMLRPRQSTPSYEGEWEPEADNNYYA
jgi:hypothetical protein